MEEVFSKVLNDGESIRKVLKPTKAPFILHGCAMPALICVMFLIMGLVSSTSGSIVGIIIALCASFLVLVISLIYCSLLFKNTFYCITNTRLIIRTGVFGIDFQFLDFKDIEAIDVKVGLINKMCGNKSGSILIGTKARPIVSMTSSFAFRDVEMPYELSKKLKERVDQLKSSTEQPKTKAAKKDIVVEIERLKKLLDDKAITKEEFEKLKSELLNG